MIKIYSEAEISRIGKACRVAADCLEVLKNSVSQGMTTEDLDMIAQDFLKKHGAKPAFLGYRGFRNQFVSL